jgi:hypothetical protein
LAFEGENHESFEYDLKSGVGTNEFLLLKAESAEHSSFMYSPVTGKGDSRRKAENGLGGYKETNKTTVTKQKPKPVTKQTAPFQNLVFRGTYVPFIQGYH